MSSSSSISTGSTTAASWRRKETIPADMPIAASVKPGQEQTYAHLLERLFVWSHSPNAAELDGFAALVEAADRTRPDEQS